MKSFQVLLQEANEVLAYDDGKGNLVYAPKHEDKDISHRGWWDSFEDESFLKYVKKGLEVIPKRKPAGTGIRFALVDKKNKPKRALMVSTRTNKRNGKITSFDIVTILNKDSKDIRGDLKLAIADSNIIVCENKENQVFMVEGYEVDYIIYVDEI